MTLVVPATAHVSTVDVVLLAVVVVLLAGAAVLALAETALVRTNRAKALALHEEKRRGSGPLLRLVEEPQDFLNPVLLVVLVCQLVTATLVGIVAERLFGAWGVAAASVFEVVVIFVLAEALPKNWAVYNPERAALFVAPIVSTLVRFPPLRLVSSGLIGLANLLVGPRHRRRTVSERELLALADVAVAEDVIEHQERELIHSIIEFGDTIVREVMVPRPDMCCVEADVSVSHVLDVAMAAGFSRLPVHEGNLDDIVAIAYTKDLIRAEREDNGERPVRDFTRPASFVPETKRVSRLMREMQENKSHLAIVVDEYGGTAGLVTLEDLIEELVGEIVDEYDVEEPPVQLMEAGEVSVTARLPVDELNELVDAELPEGDWDTVGGLLFNVLGRVPVEGEAVDVDGVRLMAERVQGHRIGRIRITPLSAPAGPGDGPDDARGA